MDRFLAGEQGHGEWVAGRAFELMNFTNSFIRYYAESGRSVQEASREWEGVPEERKRGLALEVKMQRLGHKNDLRLRLLGLGLSYREMFELHSHKVAI